MATDSIQEQDPHDEPQQKKAKSRRPGNTAFRQQRLKAWQPILTPKTVLPIFFAVGVIFAPIGGLLLWSSSSVQEISIDYTRCNTTATDTFEPIPDNAFSMSFKSKNTTKPQWKREVRQVNPPYSVPNITAPVCTLQFSIPNDIGPAVYMYYRLTNFYQNHRRYVKSLDTDQLKGQVLDNNTISKSSCDPLKIGPNNKAYYPCGLIANSLFNDTLQSPTFVNEAGGQDNVTFHMSRKGISWSSDAALFKKTSYSPDQVTPPPNWAVRYPNGYNNDTPIPDLSQYEELQVWMRTAGLPTFSKLARRNDTQVMKAGTYEMEIYDFFPVMIYGGTKTMFISTRTVMGGKNNFLGIAYIVVGGLCMVLGVLFTLAHLIKPRKLGDHTYLSWNNADSQPSATASGRDARPGTAH